MLPSPEIPNISSTGSPDRVTTSSGTELCLRTYQSRDWCEIRCLYKHGLLAGFPDPADPATDLDHIEDVYLKRPQDHFWVAEANGDVIGSIAVLKDDKQIGHIRRLRVNSAWKLLQRGEVARALIRKATHHAREHECLKLVLHTPVDDDPAIAFLHQLGFEYARARELRGRHLLEFYLNIYMRPDRAISGDEQVV